MKISLLFLLSFLLGQLHLTHSQAIIIDTCKPQASGESDVLRQIQMEFAAFRLETQREIGQLQNQQIDQQHELQQLKDHKIGTQRENTDLKERLGLVETELQEMKDRLHLAESKSINSKQSNSTRGKFHMIICLVISERRFSLFRHFLASLFNF